MPDNSQLLEYLISHPIQGIEVKKIPCDANDGVLCGEARAYADQVKKMTAAAPDENLKPLPEMDLQLLQRTMATMERGPDNTGAKHPSLDGEQWIRHTSDSVDARGPEERLAARRSGVDPEEGDG